MPAPDRRQRAVRGASATPVLGPWATARSETSPAADGGPVEVQRFLLCGPTCISEMTMGQWVTGQVGQQIRVGHVGHGSVLVTR